MNGTQTVVVVHREMMVAEGLAAALGSYRGILPIAVATTASEAERLTERADAVALDGELADVNAVAARLRAAGVRVVVIGGSGDQEDGASVSTSSSVAVLAEALVPGLLANQQAEKPLTNREEEVLSLVARGYAAKQVAKQLGISHKTVELHKSRIFTKLGVSNQAAAVSMAISTGMTKGASWNSVTI